MAVEAAEVPRVTPKKPRQRGFFVNREGDTLRVRPQAGDTMLKIKEKRTKSKRPTPFEEVMDLIAQQRAWLDSVGPHEVVNQEGDVETVTIGLGATYRGPVEGIEPAKRPSVESLSPGGRKLYYKLQREAREKVNTLRQIQSPGVEPLIPGVHYDPHASVYPGVYEEGVDWETLRKMSAFVAGPKKEK